MPSLPKPTLPPLTAVRAFEAAARHLSFTRAAAELHVTQSAVSHQVRTLEAWLGFPLFRRCNREIQLTGEGVSYLPAVRAALNKLRSATERLVHRDYEGLLCISTTESFATNWLIARLPKFFALHPSFDVRITTQNPVDEFGNESEDVTPPWIDVVIRYGRGNWLGLRSMKLFGEEIAPVCSPELLGGAYPLNDPYDLRQHVLLHDDMQMQWRTWLSAAGHDDIDATRGPRFSHSHMVITAAVQGLGVALGRSALVEQEITAGRLVRLFGRSVPAEYGYYVLMREAAVDQPKVKLFQDWLLTEASQFARE
ncbi:MAG TPA: transcriptional regulator GcvA [Steroidobacter sp.]